MRRDMDLIREVMLKLEVLPLQTGASQVISPRDKRVAVEGYSFQEMEYHLDQIRQARFVEAGSGKPPNGITFRSLTPKGHDFIDSVREPAVWTATKAQAEKVGGWTVSILVEFAKGYLKAKAAEHGFPIG